MSESEMMVLEHISKKMMELAKDDNLATGERVIARLGSSLADRVISLSKKVQELDEHIVELIKLVAPALQPVVAPAAPIEEVAAAPQQDEEVFSPEAVAQKALADAQQALAAANAAPPMPPLPARPKKNKGNGTVVNDARVQAALQADENTMESLGIVGHSKDNQ